jgi:hypothetical protein
MGDLKGVIHTEGFGYIDPGRQGDYILCGGT